MEKRVRVGPGVLGGDVGVETATPPEPNNPAYKPQYKELEEARASATELRNGTRLIGTHCPGDPGFESSEAIFQAIRWLAAEVRVMRLERALER